MPFNSVKKLTLVVLACVFSSYAWGQEKTASFEIEDTIEGQQAQPKLLFILPWQEQNDTELKLTRGQLMDRRFLSPIEREGFQQETQLIQKLK